jgi:hypothetical protein
VLKANAFWDERAVKWVTIKHGPYTTWRSSADASHYFLYFEGNKFLKAGIVEPEEMCRLLCGPFRMKGK